MCKTSWRTLVCVAISLLGGACAEQAGIPTPTAASGPCVPSLTNAPSDVPPGGGTLSAWVVIGQGCAWSVEPNGDWLKVTQPVGSFSGPGLVEVEVTANTQGERRTATVRIGDLSFTIAQSANCVYAVSPGSATVSAAGGVAEFAVATASGCAWSASAGDAWVTVLSASGQGSGPVRVSAAPSGLPEGRSASLTIAGVSVTLQQQPANCGYDVSPSTETLPTAGGTFTIRVDTGNPNCRWTAAANAPWILLSAIEGTGRGNVLVTVAANPSGPRSGTIAVAGRSVAVVQRSEQCDVSASTGAITIPGAGGTGSFRVHAAAGCDWSIREYPDWVNISPSSSSGSVEVSVSANANPLDVTRSGSLRVGSSTVRVVQERRPPPSPPPDEDCGGS